MVSTRRKLAGRWVVAAVAGGAVLAAVGAARRRPRDRHRLALAFNKYALNPIFMRFAGRGTFYASVMHHTGRRSGRTYATPVIADPIAAGFVVPLPYGAETDWCRNVLATGRATIERHGERFPVVEPRVVDMAAISDVLPARHRRVWRRMGMRQFVLLRRAEAPGAEPKAPAGMTGLA